jgi:hypothetical protein
VAIDNRTRERAALDHLIEERVQHRYELFFVTGEGKALPDDLEETSGYVLDETGRVFSFWVDWDESRSAPTLTEWEQVEAEPHWTKDPEYRRAREIVRAQDG